MIQEAQLQPEADGSTATAGRPDRQPQQDQQHRVDPRADLAPGSDVGATLEHQWFEFDRIDVLRQIDKVRSAIAENAKELGMVAAEGVFEMPLSAELLRSSRALGTIAQELKRLRGLVTRTTRYAKAKKKRT